MDTLLLQHISDACRHAEAIAGIYAKLRAGKDNRSRASLLKDAEAYANALNARLGTVAQLAGGVLPDAESVAAMHELGALMEQVMVQEREYRISAGGEADSPPSQDHG